MYELCISYSVLTSSFFFQTDPRVDESPSDASVLQGSNHTFWCRGTGNYIEWEINGQPTYQLKEHPRLMVVDLDYSIDDGCDQGCSVTMHAVNAPEVNTSSAFTIQCVIKKDPLTAEVSEAHLDIHGKFISKLCVNQNS